MERELNILAEASGFEIEVIDVDADPELEALYDELVPVLLHEGQELCHYFLEVAKVRDYLNKIG